jgi:predicted hydrocarbon binding protein
MEAGGTTYDFLQETWHPEDDAGVARALEEHFQVAGLLSLRDLRIDRERVQLVARFTRSFEAAPFQAGAGEPVCHFLRGLFCGLASKMLGGTDFVGDEAACEGRGDTSCEIRVHLMFERQA